MRRHCLIDDTIVETFRHFYCKERRDNSEFLYLIHVGSVYTTGTVVFSAKSSEKHEKKTTYKQVPESNCDQEGKLEQSFLKNASNVHQHIPHSMQPPSPSDYDIG
jgi:hypothetical protein